jgi:hypothetical protein
MMPITPMSTFIGAMTPRMIAVIMSRDAGTLIQARAPWQVV